MAKGSEAKQRDLCLSCVHLYKGLVSGQLLFCRMQQKLVYPHMTCKQFQEKK